MNSLTYELIRQAMRWAGFLLVAKGLPPEYADTLSDPAFVQAIGGGLIALAESGWLLSKWRQFQAWRARK